MFLLGLIEEDIDRQELKGIIFNKPRAEAALDWQDDEWVPPWFDNEEQNVKEARAFAAWTRKTGGDK